MPAKRPDSGATSVEYTLLALFIAVAAVMAMTLFGEAVRQLFELGNGAIPGD